jgi:hypothetical protein
MLFLKAVRASQRVHDRGPGQSKGAVEGFLVVGDRANPRIISVAVHARPEPAFPCNFRAERPVGSATPADFKITGAPNGNRTRVFAVKE